MFLLLEMITFDYRSMLGILQQLHNAFLKTCSHSIIVNIEVGIKVQCNALKTNNIIIIIYFIFDYCNCKIQF